MDERTAESVAYILTVADKAIKHYKKLLSKRTEVTKEDIREFSNIFQSFHFHTARVGLKIDDCELRIKKLCENHELLKQRFVEQSALIKKENKGTKH